MRFKQSDGAETISRNDLASFFVGGDGGEGLVVHNGEADLLLFQICRDNRCLKVKKLNYRATV